MVFFEKFKAFNFIIPTPAPQTATFRFCHLLVSKIGMNGVGLTPTAMLPL